VKSIRTDIFPHFFNRDSREIAGLFSTSLEHNHRYWLRAGLNACAILCENRCIFPPGFAIEDDLAFSVIEEQKSFLTNGLIVVAIKEDNIADLIEKKRREYSSEKERYINLYDDSRVDFLIASTTSRVLREFGAGEKIVQAWNLGAESKSPIWRPIQKGLGLRLTREVGAVPGRLQSNGLAATWSGIKKHIPRNAGVATKDLRAAVQNAYFSAYIDAYDLNIVKDIPYIWNDFGLRPKVTWYSFKALHDAMRAFHLEDILLEGHAETILLLRRKPAFIEFTDVVVESAKMSSAINLTYMFERAASISKHDWKKSQSRRKGDLFLRMDPCSDEELEKIANASAWVRSELNSASRQTSKKVARKTGSKKNQIRIGDEMINDALLVAAAQELSAVRRMLDEHNIVRSSYPNLVGLTGEVFEIDNANHGRRRVGLFLARAKGKSAMMELVGRVVQKHHPERVLLVGMMAGISGKCNLLDVICPATVHDVTAIGTKSDEIVIEPEPSRMDPYMLHWLIQYDWTKNPLSFEKIGGKLVAHKKTLCVPAKWEDYGHVLCQKALQVDPENIIGLEMEATALSERSITQHVYAEQTRYLMLKGVADYAGGKIDNEEAVALSSTLGIEEIGDGDDPINNKQLRLALQSAATERATEVALRILVECS
jgi:hypothetical protein